jgi:hypothetical protein
MQTGVYIWQYMKETLELLVVPLPVSPGLPPLDLTGWKDWSAEEITFERG